jgi:YidC/Oxa1 family membrane protein insertase
MTPADSAVALVPVDTAVVATAVATYRTTNTGASLIGTELTQYQALKDRGRTKSGTVELALPQARLLGYRLVIPGDTIDLGAQRFVTTTTTSNGQTTVRYDATLAPSRTVAITYSFLPDSYRVNVSAAVAGVPENSFLLVDLPTGFRSSEADSAEDHAHLAYAFKRDAQGAEGVAFSSLDPGERQIEAGPISWAVAKSKYFILGVLTPAGQPGFAEVNFTGGQRLEKTATRGLGAIIMPLKAGNAAFEVYAGPQEFRRLVAIGREFETSNPYGGWFQGMVQPFATMVIRVLLWMKEVLGLSYGWILVVFGIAIRVILWPLNQKAMRSSMQLQRIQPELQAIQERYKGDPQKLQAAMMQVYKEHGMSPFSSLSGCLPMLIPMPVFFALFFVFQNTIEFRGVSFLWFPDISVKDPLYIIPVLVALTTLLLSWIGMRGIKGNEQQKLMMYLMPGMMLFIFLNMASGLNLYYFIQNLASLPQQWLISKERAKPHVRG